MNVVFLMLELPADSNSSNLYLDLALEFKDNGHNVYIIAPAVSDQKNLLVEERGLKVLRVKTLQLLGVKSFLRKGLAQFLLPFQYNEAYNKFLKHIVFDLILMPTPPITLITVVRNIKKRTKGKFYLILRDIYPQGAADIGLVKFKAAYYYLRYLEQKTYYNADYIGCMSQGNVEYIASHNPGIPYKKLVLLPNWQKNEKDSLKYSDIRKKYQLQDKYIVLFGGTIGYAQKIDNIITLALHYKDNSNIVFLVIGKGVMKEYLEDKIKSLSITNVLVLDNLPRTEYLEFVNTSDIGLISIDERFTVPTIPSKTTSYMNFSLPILAIIDAHTDYGKILEEANAGLWSIGGDEEKLFANFDLLYNNSELRQEMGNAGYEYFLKYLTSEKAYLNIMDSIKD
jgi:glycosyltransferase involved in cell wall biosynthesis